MRVRLIVISVGCLSGCGRTPAPPATDTPSAAAAAADSQRARTTRDSLHYVRWNLPTLAGVGLDRGGYAERYEVFIDLNPYYQRGLFDEDSIPDVAVRIVEKSSGKVGLAIIHGGDSTVHILGAGNWFGNGGDDFRWAWVWRVEPSAARPDISPLGRELLYVEKPEAAGAMLWWDGKKYVWTQHGD